MQTVLNQLVYFAFLQSAFLLVIYAFSKKIRKTVNPYLIVLIAVMMIGLLGRIWIIKFDGIQRLYSLSEYAVFLFGATVYLFTKSTLKGNNEFSRKDLVHYIPGVIYIIALSYYYVFAPNELVIQHLESGELFWAVVIFMGTGLLVNGTYWWLSVKVFFEQKRRLTDESSYTIQYGFFQNFLIAVGLCLLTWLIVYIIGIAGESWLEREIRPFIWVALGFLMLFISFYSIKEPILFKASKQLKVAKYAQSKLTNEELEEPKKAIGFIDGAREALLEPKLNEG